MPNLIIAAYWTDDEHDLATTKAIMTMKGHITGSGAVVSLAAENVDTELRVILRRLQLEEAADWQRKPHTQGAP